LLERHHGYIQWLFPIRETGMNFRAEKLQLHEAEKIKKDPECQKRVVRSYQLMLDFYGMRMKNETTGELERSKNWKDRYRNLNFSFHNNLRITRILKSLGELGFERFKLPFCKFVWEEIDNRCLSNCKRSALSFWFPVLRSIDERRELYKLVTSREPELKDVEHRPERLRKPKKTAQSSLTGTTASSSANPSAADAPDVCTSEETNRALQSSSVPQSSAVRQSGSVEPGLENENKAKTSKRLMTEHKNSSPRPASDDDEEGKDALQLLEEESQPAGPNNTLVGKLSLPQEDNRRRKNRVQADSAQTQTEPSDEFSDMLPQLAGKQSDSESSGSASSRSLQLQNSYSDSSLERPASPDAESV